MRRVEIGCRVSLVCLTLFGGAGVVLAAEAKAKPAHLTVRLPAAAVLTIAGVKSEQEGPVREFDSPPLPPGKTFAYQVRATWRAMDREVVRQERVLVRAGDKVEVDLTTPAPKSSLPAPRLLRPLRLDSPLPDVLVQPGEAMKFPLRVHRGEVKGPVQLTFEGVPTGITLPAVTLLAGKAAGMAEVRVGAEAAPGSYPVRVTAQAGSQTSKGRFNLIVRKATALLKLTAQPALALAPGGEGMIEVTVEGAQTGRPLQVTLPPLPPGMTLGPVTVRATVQVAKGTALGEQGIRVQADSGTARAETAVALQVRAAAPPKSAPSKPSPADSGKPEAGGQKVVPASPARTSLKIALPSQVSLQPGETKLLPVVVRQEGVTGPVTFQFESMPPGITVPRQTRTPRRGKVYLQASAAADAPLGSQTIKVIAACGEARTDATLTIQVGK